MLHVVGTIGLAARFVLALILHIDLLEVALASAGFYLFPRPKVEGAQRL